jgi:hypothetical protein
VQYDDLKRQPIEDLVNQVQGLASVASQSQVQSIAALAARLTIELSAGLDQLSNMVFTAKKQFVDRLDGLTAEIHATQLEISKASTEASAHTAALVRWTKVLVIVTGAYTLITGGLSPHRHLIRLLVDRHYGQRAPLAA